MFFNILVVGPCDSGKTTFIENISKKLDKRYKINLINSCSNASKFANTDEANQNQGNRRRPIRKTSIGKYLNNQTFLFKINKEINLFFII